MATKKATTEADLFAPVLLSYDGIYSASFRYPPFQLDPLLQAKGWQVVEDMQHNSACRANFNLKRYSILNEEPQIVPAVTDAMDTRHSEAKEYADFVSWCFDNIQSKYGAPIDKRSVFFEVLRGQWDGFRVSEIGYRYLEEGPYAGKIGFSGFYHKHAKQIGFDLDSATSEVIHITSYTPGALLTQTGSVQVVPGGYDFQVPLDRCLHYVFNPDSNLPFGNGDWRPCFPEWQGLLNNHKFWVRANERWGNPALVLKGVNDQNKNATLETMKGVRNGGDVALPKEMDVLLLTAPQQYFENLRSYAIWAESNIAKVILCSTLTTSADGGTKTNALGQVHQDSKQAAVDYGEADIEGLFRKQVIDRLLRLNFPNYNSDLCPKLQLSRQEPDDLLQRVQAIGTAIDKGIIWKGAKWIREECGWPSMDPDEEKGLEEEKKAEQEAQQQLADARNSGTVARMSDHRDIEDTLDLLRRLNKAYRKEAA